MTRKLSDICTALGKVIQKPQIQISFLSYLLQGTKNILIDTVPIKAAEKWQQELLGLLDGKPIDALILNHSEEDHSGALTLLVDLFPNIPVYCTVACKDRLNSAYPNVNFVCVEHGSSVQIGDFSFRFLHTPGLHWDDNMVTLWANEDTLFSNDLFGQYIGCDALVDEVVPTEELLAGTESYFEKVFASAPSENKRVLAEIMKLNFHRITPGHGVVLETHLSKALEFYESNCLANF